MHGKEKYHWGIKMQEKLIYVWEWFWQHIDSLPRMLGVLVLLGIVVCVLYSVIFMREE